MKFDYVVVLLLWVPSLLSAARNRFNTRHSKRVPFGSIKFLIRSGLNIVPKQFVLGTTNFVIMDAE